MKIIRGVIILITVQHNNCRPPTKERNNTMPSKTRVITALLLAVQGAHGFLSHAPASCDRTRVVLLTAAVQFQARWFVVRIASCAVPAAAAHAQ